MQLNQRMIRSNSHMLFLDQKRNGTSKLVAHSGLGGRTSMRIRLGTLAYSICLLLSLTHLFAQTSSDHAAVEVATKVIRPEQIRAHIRFLADSLLKGREPGTPGYDIAARYVATELEGMALHPGVSGSWFQPVPLQKAVTNAAASSLSLTVKGKEQKLVDAKDYVLSTWFAGTPAIGKPSGTKTDVNAPVVFVGFGVTAPDQKYDDYTGVDVRGKLILT